MRLKMLASNQQRAVCAESLSSEKAEWWRSERLGSSGGHRTVRTWRYTTIGALLILASVVNRRFLVQSAPAIDHLLSSEFNCMMMSHTTSEIPGSHYTEYILNYTLPLQRVRLFSFTAVSDETY